MFPAPLYTLASLFNLPRDPCLGFKWVIFILYIHFYRPGSIIIDYEVTLSADNDAEDPMTEVQQSVNEATEQLALSAGFEASVEQIAGKELASHSTLNLTMSSCWPKNT